MIDKRPDLGVILEQFLASVSTGKTEATRLRYDRVLQRLDEFMDTADAAPHLGTQLATLLAAEREFDRRGAFARLLGAEELVCCLPGFVADEWLGTDVSDARAQVSLAGRLLVWLRRRQLIDMRVCACAFWEAEGAVALARSRARGSRPVG